MKAKITGLMAALYALVMTMPALSQHPVMEDLMKGNDKFVRGEMWYKGLKSQRSTLTSGQKPPAVVITCSDSRVPPELIFGKSLGEVFTIRTAGNVAGPIDLGSIEYGVEHLHAPLLVVMGHQSCGAVTAAVDMHQKGGNIPGNIPSILDMIIPAVKRLGSPGSNRTAFIERAIDENVQQSIRDIAKNSEIVAHLVEKGDLSIVGAKYSLATGRVETLINENESRALLPVGGNSYGHGGGGSGGHGGGGGHDVHGSAPSGGGHGASHGGGSFAGGGHGGGSLGGVPMAAAGFSLATQLHAAETSGSHGASASRTKGGDSIVGPVVLFVLAIALAGFFIYRYAIRKSLKVRLYSNAGLLLMVMVALSAFVYNEFVEINKELDIIANDDIPILSELSEAEASMLAETLDLTKFSYTGDQAAVAAFRQEGMVVKRDLDLVLEQLKDAEAAAPTEAARRRFAEIRQETRDLVQHHSEFATLGERMVTLVSGNAALQRELAATAASSTRTELAALEQQLVAKEVELRREFARVISGVKDETLAEANHAHQLAEQGELVIMLINALAIVVGLIITFFLVRDTIKLLNGMATTLSQTSDEMASASNQTASASQTVAQSASEMAASMEETSSSVEEMTAMIQQNAGNARQASDLTEGTVDVVQRSNQAMQEMSVTMQSIQDASGEMGKIIKVIEEIAFQTNLLALNAAVEAARAGEHGKGFAVVAEEVRNLAQRAASSAKDTTALIEKAEANVSDGMGKVDRVAEGLKEVTDSANRVSKLVDEIAKASGEQAQGISQINVTVSDLDKVVQGVASSSEETTSVSEEMSAQANALRDTVQQIVNLIGDTEDTMGGGHVMGTGIAARAHQLNQHSPQKSGGNGNAGGNGNGHGNGNGVKNRLVSVKSGVQQHLAKAKQNIRGVEKASIKPEEVLPLDASEVERF